MEELFFGVARVAECYHRSRTCPAIKSAERKLLIDIMEYANEKEAFDRGHVRRCRMCSGQRAFRITPKPEPKPKRVKAPKPARIPRDKDYGIVRLTNEQHEALKNLSSITKDKGPTTLRELAEKRNRSIVATFLMMKPLAEKGLVTKTIEVGHRKAKSGTLEPTEEGHRIAGMTPLSEREARAAVQAGA